MKHSALIVPALLALAACQPSPPKPKPAAPEADAQAPAAFNFTRPITARGTEPFWSLTLGGTHVKLTRVDHPDVAAETPAPAIQSGRAVWIATAPDQQITITLYESACTAGMSDTQYPLTAEVTLVNETLRGCAGVSPAAPAAR